MGETAARPHCPPRRWARAPGVGGKVVWLWKLVWIRLALLLGTVVKREWRWVRNIWSDEEISWLQEGVVSTSYWITNTVTHWDSNGFCRWKSPANLSLPRPEKVFLLLKVLDDQWQSFLILYHRDIITGATWTTLLSRSAASLCLIPFISVILGSVKLRDKLLTSVKLSELKLYNAVSKECKCSVIFEASWHIQLEIILVLFPSLYYLHSKATMSYT